MLWISMIRKRGRITERPKTRLSSKSKSTITTTIRTVVCKQSRLTIRTLLLILEQVTTSIWNSFQELQPSRPQLWKRLLSDLQKKDWTSRFRNNICQNLTQRSICDSTQSSKSCIKCYLRLSKSWLRKRFTSIALPGQSIWPTRPEKRWRSSKKTKSNRHSSTLWSL